MNKFIIMSTFAPLLVLGAVNTQAQETVDTTTGSHPRPTVQQLVPAPNQITAPTSITLPADTIIRVSPVTEITSKKMKEGETREFRVAEEVRRDGMTIIPINSPVVATVTYRTGKGIFGKSAKFELTFTSINIDGQTYTLTGTHRQEGRGNTAAALLVSGIITGRSAEMLPDQVVNARTTQDITFTR